MADSPSKPLMRSIGEFFGHLVKAVKSDPSRRSEVGRTVEEEERQSVVLRRTTIEEIEFKERDSEPPCP